MQKSCPTQFTGHKTYKLDPKGRVAFPSHWKTEENVSFKLFCAKRDGYPVIKCYTESSFAQLITTIRHEAEARGATFKEIEKYAGAIIASCIDGELNNQRKFPISKEHREQLALDNQLMLVGRGDFLEIWKPEDYDAVYGIEKLQDLELDKIFGIFS